MKVTTYGPNGISDATFHVHAMGCSCSKKAYGRAEKYNEDLDSLEQYMSDAFGDFFDESGTTWEDYLGEVRFFPCTDEGVKAEMPKSEREGGNTWNMVNGLGPRQREVMNVLIEIGDSGVKAGTKIGKMDKAWTTEVLEGLFHKGLVVRTLDEAAYAKGVTTVLSYSAVK